jgi:hypothetical protein
MFYDMANGNQNISLTHSVKKKKKKNVISKLLNIEIKFNKCKKKR